jgi:hypothetical protein
MYDSRAFATAWNALTRPPDRTLEVTLSIGSTVFMMVAITSE